MAGLLILLMGVSTGKKWAVWVLQVLAIVTYLDCWKTFSLMSFWSAVGLTVALGWGLAISLVFLCGAKSIREEFQLQPKFFERSPRRKTFSKVSGWAIWLFLGAFFLI